MFHRCIRDRRSKKKNIFRSNQKPLITKALRKDIITNKLNLKAELIKLNHQVIC